MPQKIQERLRRRRRELNLTQTQVAESIGAVVRTYSSWETGDTEPGATHVAALAKALRCTSDYLLGLSEFENSLPPGAWVVDQDVVDAYRAGKAVNRRMAYAVAIPQRPQLMSSAEYAAIEMEIRNPPRKQRRD